jgi:hypothetical protein
MEKSSSGKTAVEAAVGGNDNVAALREALNGSEGTQVGFLEDVWQPLTEAVQELHVVPRVRGKCRYCLWARDEDEPAAYMVTDGRDASQWITTRKCPQCGHAIPETSTVNHAQHLLVWFQRVNESVATSITRRKVGQPSECKLGHTTLKLVAVSLRVKVATCGRMCNAAGDGSLWTTARWPPGTNRRPRRRQWAGCTRSRM